MKNVAFKTHLLDIYKSRVNFSIFEIKAAIK
jgi:hypothetical protein